MSHGSGDIEVKFTLCNPQLTEAELAAVIRLVSH